MNADGLCGLIMYCRLQLNAEGLSAVLMAVSGHAGGRKGYLAGQERR